MCGRFNLHAPPADIARHFGLPEPPDVPPRYNISPTQAVGAVLEEREHGRRWDWFRWGLIPHWAKELGRFNTINARAETITEKPAFRGPLRYKRCLVPASGFYEWAPGAGKGSRKQPYHFHRPDGELFAIAGLYDRWLSPDGSEVPSLTLVVTGANDDVAGIHDRMPVILDPADYALWLDPEVQKPDAVVELLRPAPAGTLVAEPIGVAVNSPRNEGPDLLAPVARDSHSGSDPGRDAGQPSG